MKNVIINDSCCVNFCTSIKFIFRQKYTYHISADTEAHVRGLDLAKVREVAFQDEYVEDTAEHADGTDPFVSEKRKNNSFFPINFCFYNKRKLTSYLFTRMARDRG